MRFVVNTELHNALDIVNIQTRMLGEFDLEKEAVIQAKQQYDIKILSLINSKEFRIG
jgi:hypothetical protein